MLDEAGFKVAGYAAVVDFIVRFANQDVNVVEGSHQLQNHSSKKAGLPKP